MKSFKPLLSIGAMLLLAGQVTADNMTISADQVTISADNKLHHLRGEVVMQIDGNQVQVKSDRVILDDSQTLYDGNVVVELEAGTLYSDSAVMTNDGSTVQLRMLAADIRYH